VHHRRARLAVLLSFLFALAFAQPSSSARVTASDQSFPVVDDGSAAASLTQVPSDTTALLADFDGDHRTDLLWYGPGAKDDHLWLGRPDRNFVGVPITVRRSYLPLVGDFNGNGRADVLWYGPGSDPDILWFGRSGGGFSGRSVTVNGTYQPFTGDFDGDGRRDVVWWAPGPPNDVLWFGHSNRRFTSRSTTVDLGYARALAIRPDVLASKYDPYGFVAHAFAAIDGHIYTNTLEAFRRNYDRGFRVFECDQVLLADGTVLVAHNGLEANYGLNKSFRDATWADLEGHKYLGTYTILRSQNVLRLMIDHPDIFVIPDLKYSRPEIYRTYVRQAKALGRPDLLERLLPHVADQTELNTFRVYYPLQNYVLALYHTQAQNRYDDPVATDFVRRNRTPAVMMWWRDRDFSLSLAANGLEHRRYRKAFADALRAAGAVVYVHSLGNPNEIQRFWDLGIGVYSDDPFPPLGTTTPTLRTPSFSGPTAEKANPPA
jgi:glycerophosphoryl diester phosphodiesterase